ncbi:Peroxisomal ATPase PEX6 [Rhodotorula toruloides]|uniref:Peroxisomal ATPase PEX6 n=1 Tax=Rhodotorula toruloides TaxID=5286 RepID=A0A2S9ZZ64_RHOTO|nr:Peroxisomal ATPase PEX6 [Rhodotorula toruloides]PRQ71031.1 P-loop containing nucleoside triphosphate hydrolase protein [Rhodotorula toruloides]
MDSHSAHYCTLQTHSTTALASPALWTALVDSLPGPDRDDPPTRLALALAPRHARSARAKELRTVVVRAREASKLEMKEAGEDLPENVLLLPTRLVQAHPAVFTRRSSSSPTSASPPSLSLTIAQTVPLSSAIFLSLDSASYTNASDKSGRLETLLAGKDADLVREGDVVDLPGVGRWKVAVTEPVLQGVFVKGQTRLLVLPPADGGAQEDEADARLADGTDASEEDDLLDFDIDDSFLASTVLPSRRSHATPFTSPLPSSAQNGKSFPLVAPPPTTHSGTPISALPLSFPVPAESLTPTPDADEDDLPHALASTADLGRLGLFSGDWALVEPSGAMEGEEQKEEDRGRLVRVFAGEGLLEGREVVTSSAPTLYLPPPLLFNLLGPSSLSSSLSSPVTLTLHPAPLLSPILPLPLPTASSLTISRLASPHSVNKLYQPLFLEGLKEYFSGRRRAVKRGDVICVGIDEEKVRFVGEGKGEGVEEDFDLPAESTTPTAVVHFLITSLSVDPSTSSSAPTGDFDLDRRLEDGLLGCFVDPKVTKLLQTGVERGRVPDDAGWMGIEPSPNVSLAPDSLLGTPTPASKLYDFLLSSLTPRASTYSLPLTALLKGALGSGKRNLIRSVARRAGVGLLELDCFDLLGESDAKTEGRLRALAVDKALACAPVVLVLRNVEALARKSQAMETGQEPPMTTVLRDCFATIRDGWKASGHPVVVVATTTDVEKVPTGVLGLFKEEIGIQAPAEPERLAILRNLTASDIISPDVSLRSLAVQTAALVANDLVDLVRRARAAAAERVLELASSTDATTPAPSLADIAHAGVALTSLDFNSALEKARSAYSESIGAPKIPNVTWDDVGGLANVKSDILDTIQLPLEHPELFADGLKKRSGILLYGPPGTGKTLLAKAVATSCSLNFFSVKGPELLNMYIGESEANVRRVFQRARDAKPCVVFMDELDSVAPKRGNQGDSGGVMDRIVSQLLAELDGMSEGKGGNDVFVIGATNRPDLLDPALLRPGRFDRMLYLGVSNTHQAQLNIIQALTRKFKLAPETDLAKLAEKCTFNLTGADFYALCSDAMLKAMTRKAEEVDKRIAELNAQPPYSTGETPPLTPQYYLAEMATPAEIEVLVAQQDFDAALAELVPSVSQAEMNHYKTVQQRFSAETMNSDDNLAAQEKKEAAPVSSPSPSLSQLPAAIPGPFKPNGVVKGPVEKVVSNGLVVDGVQDVVDPEEEEKRRKRRAAKGKGKARAE